MPNLTNIHNRLQSFYMIRRGIIVGIPIMLGFLPVAITYGVLAKQSGMSLAELTFMSAFVYAGASQFMGINMMAAGSTVLEIIVATFVLNFRHFVMGLSFMNRFREMKLSARIPLSVLLTDETFAMSSVNTEEVKQEKGTLFYLTLFLVGYISWVLGSVLGGILGEVIPEKVSQSMGIALYAMFIGLLTPSVKKELKIGIIAVISMCINLVFSQFMSDGWAIVLGTVLGGLSGVIILQEDE